jgi:hypothetical protein
MCVSSSVPMAYGMGKMKTAPTPAVDSLVEMLMGPPTLPA